MNKAGSAAKVKLNSFDDLFGAEQPQAGIEQVQKIALSELYEFKGHPFKVLDDEKMQETVESVREHGVLMPGIARPRAEGGYEIIAGHRRRHACELVGLETMPMFIRNYTDDEATIIMVDSNIQREDILPSEKAKAYRMKYEAMKHQGKVEKFMMDPVGPKWIDELTDTPASETGIEKNGKVNIKKANSLKGNRSNEQLARMVGESVTQIESYDNGWSKISYNGKECYCMTEYLE